MARRKTSKRKASLEKRKASLEIEQTPGRPVLNRLTPVSILSQDEVESLHQASLKVLAEHGIQFSLSEARAILKTAGAEVQDSDGMVRFDPDMLMDYLAKAPAAFTLHARNPAHDLRLGDGHVNFSSVSSAPHCTDTLKGRRAGNREDFENFLRLTQAVNVAHGSAGYPVEPIDIPVPVRHLYATRAILALTDKTFRLYNHSRQRTLDVLEMTRIAHKLSEEEFVEKPCVFASINPNSPREYDESMLWGMIECARAGQVLMISPFILAGAMAGAKAGAIFGPKGKLIGGALGAAGASRSPSDIGEPARNQSLPSHRAGFRGESPTPVDSPGGRRSDSPFRGLFPADHADEFRRFGADQPGRTLSPGVSAFHRCLSAIR
jgi:trimethylamine--corrinoid protein Co-methyltransferase